MNTTLGIRIAGLFDRRTRLCALPLIVALFMPTACLADGVAFKGLDWSSMIPAQENEQIAAINFADGVQRMIIAVNINVEEDERCLWLLPVPGSPGDVDVEIQDEYPEFFGRDPTAAVQGRISTIMTIIRGFELVPLLFEGCLLMAHLGGELGGVDVHDQIDKWGIHAEVLTADSTASLGDYFAEKDVALAKQQLATLTPYMNDEYSLIAVWIDSMATVREKFPYFEHLPPGRERSPCLYLEFPTEKAFFPLKPTSAYGKTEIPLRLHVMGFVKPECDSRTVLDNLGVDYFYMGRIRPDALQEWATGLSDTSNAYTRIRGTMSADSFTDDLRFTPTRPRKIVYADVVAKFIDGWSRVLTIIILLAGLSYISGGIAGMVTIKRWSRPAKLGCWNMLTLYGLNVALLQYNLTGRSGVTKRKMKREFMLAFFAVYVILSFGLQAALLAPFWF